MYVCTMAVTFAKLMTKYAYFLINSDEIGWGSTSQASISKIYKCWKEKHLFIL